MVRLVIEEIIVRIVMKENAIKRKSVVKTGKTTCQTHIWATIQTFPMTVITDASDTKIWDIKKGSDQNMRTYKSKIIRFKMDEDPLQRQIYFITFVESLEMIFSQYTETCEEIIESKNRRAWYWILCKKRLLGIFCMQIFLYTAKDWLLSSQ